MVKRDSFGRRIWQLCFQLIKTESLLNFELDHLQHCLKSTGQVPDILPLWTFYPSIRAKPTLISALTTQCQCSLPPHPRGAKRPKGQNVRLLIIIMSAYSKVWCVSWSLDYHYNVRRCSLLWCRYMGWFCPPLVSLCMGGASNTLHCKDLDLYPV